MKKNNIVKLLDVNGKLTDKDGNTLFVNKNFLAVTSLSQFFGMFEKEMTNSIYFKDLWVCDKGEMINIKHGLKESKCILLPHYLFHDLMCAFHSSDSFIKHKGAYFQLVEHFRNKDYTTPCGFLLSFLSPAEVKDLKKQSIVFKKID